MSSNLLFVTSVYVRVCGYIIETGGLHGSCEFIRSALGEIMTYRSIAANHFKNEKKRELGFLNARFCPIPVGDSPSSKRMYDVLQVGVEGEEEGGGGL